MDNQTPNDIEVGHLLSRSPPDDSPQGIVHKEVDEVSPQRRTAITKIRSCLRSSRFFLSILLLSTLLVFLTDWIAMDTRYRGVEYHSLFFKSNPRNAILVIHICSALTLLLVRKLVAISSEVLRWSLAARKGGTHFLNLLVLSDGTGFFGLCRIFFARYRKLLTSPRLLSLCRIVVSYVLLLVAQFILLLNIESETAYVKYGPINGQTTHQGLGDFNFSLGEPWPFPQIDSWLFLTDESRVSETAPTVCTANSNGTCHAFIMIATPINYTYSCPPAGCDVWQEPIVCPTENEFCDVEGIFYNFPAYLLQFEQQVNEVHYQYQLNYTSISGTKLSMWMGDSAGNENSSTIDFLFDMCQEEYKPCEIDSNPTRATIYISKANVTMILNISNQTIMDVTPINTAPYEVNVAKFFQAYTAPLSYYLINYTTIGLADNSHILPSVLPNVTEIPNASVVADAWVDSVYYGLHHNLRPQAYNTRVYGFPAHALVANARVFVPDGVNRTWSKAEPTVVLSINPLSIYIFNAITLGIMLISVVVKFKFQTDDIPQECSFPDIALVCKDLDDSIIETLRDFDDFSERFGMRTLEDTWIEVARVGDERRFSISKLSL
jgi:hypothetical protein